jgi:hypothetical protein
MILEKIEFEILNLISLSFCPVSQSRTKPRERVWRKSFHFRLNEVLELCCVETIQNMSGVQEVDINWSK